MSRNVRIAVGLVDVNEARRVGALDDWISAAAEAVESMKTIVKSVARTDNHQ